MTRNTAMPFRLAPTRAGLALLLAGALAACGSDERLREPSSIQGLDTLTVGAADAGRGRAWDGVVEAVRQAELTAQTAGRVTAVLVDVNTRVAQGQGQCAVATHAVAADGRAAGVQGAGQHFGQ